MASQLNDVMGRRQKRIAMPLYALAYRTVKRHEHGPILRAAVVTAFVPPVAAALLIWLVPETCEVWVSHARHRWTCLLPHLILVAPPVMAIVLTIFTIFNQRLDRPFPDGWMVTVLAVGLLTHVLLIGTYLVLALGQGYFGLGITAQLFSIPQPFLAGAIAAAVYWIALHWQGESATAKIQKG